MKMNLWKLASPLVGKGEFRQGQTDKGDLESSSFAVSYDLESVTERFNDHDSVLMELNR